MELHSISYGGGVQSTALLVLAAQGKITPRLALFSNVGDAAENPATLSYVEEVARPYCEANGIELVKLQRTGKNPDLYERLTRPDSRFLGIPIRMSNGAPGHRSCTADYKIAVIAKELKRRGATKENPANVYVGISTDEWMRANNRRALPHETMQYPLLDLRLSRDDCRRIITDAGLPMPEKSSCWFCPFHTKAVWQVMRSDDPAMFERAAELEDTLNAKRKAIGKDSVYLTDAGKPLRSAIPDMETLPLEFDQTVGQCDNGYCWT